MNLGDEFVDGIIHRLSQLADRKLTCFAFQGSTPSAVHNVAEHIGDVGFAFFNVHAVFAGLAIHLSPSDAATTPERRTKLAENDRGHRRH